MAHTAIVGAGINGLLLGAALARDGEKVTVFEKNSFPGGRAQLLERDGFTADYGVHLTRFGPESALAKIMRHIGHDVSFRRLGPSYCVDEKGNRELFPTSPAGIFKSAMFSFGEKLRLIGLLLGIKRGRYNDGYMEVSLREWMDREGITGGIGKYMELLSASVMVCPFVEKTSAGELFRNMHRVLATGHSAEYLSDGWKPVYAALMDEIRIHGDIRFGARVDGVIINKNKAGGVTVKGKKFPADRVVLNLPVQEIFSILPEKNFPKEYVALCKNLLPTAGLFIDIAIDGSIADYDGLLYTYNPVTYGMITSSLAPAVAPPGRQLLTMFYPTSPGDVKDPALRMKRREELWECLRRYFPDIDARILWKRESALTMVDGVQVNTEQTEGRRPKPAVPGAEGLFLVGDSVAAPGAGGDVGNESVLAAYRTITGREIG